MIKIILKPFEYILLLPVFLYKFLISPLLPHSCRFTPSCSTYALEAVKEFGIIKGSYLFLIRFSKCGPWHKGGYDPVPINLKGDKKWIF